MPHLTSRYRTQTSLSKNLPEKFACPCIDPPLSLVGLSVRPCIIITGILGRSAAHVNVARRHEWLRRPTSTNGRANHPVNSRARVPLAPFSLCGPHLGIKARLWELSRDAYMTSASGGGLGWPYAVYYGMKISRITFEVVKLVLEVRLFRRLLPVPNLFSRIRRRRLGRSIGRDSFRQRKQVFSAASGRSDISLGHWAI